jgi:hypothetical protein
MVTDDGTVAAPKELSNHVSMRERAVVSDNRRRPDYYSVRMVYDQAFAYGGSRGNLRASENRAEVARKYREKAQVMQMEPSRSPVQQNGVKTGMKQDDS